MKDKAKNVLILSTKVFKDQTLLFLSISVPMLLKYLLNLIMNQRDFSIFVSEYSVMQSDGNSLKFDTFREAITSELMV